MRAKVPSCSWKGSLAGGPRSLGSSACPPPSSGFCRPRTCTAPAGASVRPSVRHNPSVRPTAIRPSARQNPSVHSLVRPSVHPYVHRTWVGVRSHPPADATLHQRKAQGRTPARRSHIGIVRALVKGDALIKPSISAVPSRVRTPHTAAAASTAHSHSAQAWCKARACAAPACCQEQVAGGKEQGGRGINCLLRPLVQQRLGEVRILHDGALQVRPAIACRGPQPSDWLRHRNPTHWDVPSVGGGAQAAAAFSAKQPLAAGCTAAAHPALRAPAQHQAHHARCCLGLAAGRSAVCAVAWLCPAHSQKAPLEREARRGRAGGGVVGGSCGCCQAYHRETANL